MPSPKVSKKSALSSSPLRPTRPTFAAVSQHDDAPPASTPLTSPTRDPEEDIDELQSEEEVDVGGAGRGAGGGSKATIRCRWVDCGDFLPDVPTLVNHLQKEHLQPGKDSYECQWEGCARKGARQASRHSLVTHVRAHTGERPYSCPHKGCGSTFTRSDAMSKHLRTLHNTPISDDHQTKSKKPKTSINRHEPMDVDTIQDGGSEIMDIPDDNADMTYKPGGSSKKNTSSTKGKSRAKATTSAGGSTSKPKAASSRSIQPKHIQPNSSPLILVNPVPNLTETDQDLMKDKDLASVIPRIRNREVFWDMTVDDTRAAVYVRNRHPRMLGEDDGEGYDSFDEGVSQSDEIHDGVVAIVLDERGEEVEVMGRSKWQARFIMAKVKLMLVEEENNMRKKALRDLMDREEELKEALARVDNEE